MRIRTRRKLRALRYALEEAVLRSENYLAKSMFSALEGNVEKAKERMELACVWRDLTKVVVKDMEELIASELPPPPTNPLIIP
mgnify:CR=1 FL=1